MSIASNVKDALTTNTKTANKLSAPNAHHSLYMAAPKKPEQLSLEPFEVEPSEGVDDGAGY